MLSLREDERNEFSLFPHFFSCLDFAFRSCGNYTLLMRLTVCLLLLSQLLCRMEDERKGDPPETGLSDSQQRKGSSEIKDQEQSRKDDGRRHRRKPSKNEPFPGIPLKLEEEPQQQPPQKSQVKKHKISTESVPSPEDDVVVGYLKKQGPPHRPTWKKRWVVVSKDRRLTYYKSKAQSVKVLMILD